MNRLLHLIITLMICAGLPSCGGEEAPAQDKPLNVTSASISESAEINPSEVALITLTFSDDIIVANPAHSSLENDTKSTRVALSEGSVSGNAWTFPVALDYNCEYTLRIVGTSVKSKSTSVFSQPFTLKFRTGTFKIPEIDTSRIQALVNPDASAETRKVFDYLKSLYGKKMLSGAMANVNNNNDFADWMYKVSGKYPAITFYDFIHLPYSADGSWVNYADISAAAEQWKAGGLVGYGWHWLVPDHEGSDDLSYNGTFDIDRALTPGTWENDVVEEDVRKVAGYLSLLKDAGIPVLWRPFHEAAGDYKWGAWFWWGKQGLEKTKKIWRWLYDKLTNQYGLDNLIWVWTVQLYREGRLTDIENLRSAYPGDDTVDIVGPDVYNDTHDASPEFFNIINSLVGGKKMIAMPECGLLPDPDASFQTGACWSYCMLWYTHMQHTLSITAPDGFGNTPPFIREWMENPFVVTRDEMKR